MLPFARILEYGNVAPTPSGVKQLVSSSNAVYLIMSDGNCYVRGTNDTYKLGLSQNNVAVDNEWLLIGTDVAKCFGSGSNTILVKNDASVIAYGSNFTSSTGGSYALSGTNITSNFGSLNLLDCVDFIPRGNNALFLMQDGNLYGIGENSGFVYGDLAISFQTQPYLLDTNVTEISRSQVGGAVNHYIKNGILIGNGYTSFYTTGINSTAIIRPYTQISLPSGYTPLKVNSSGYSTHIIARKDSTAQMTLLYTGSSDISSSSTLYDTGVPSTVVQHTFTTVGLEYMDGIVTSSFDTTYRAGGTNLIFSGNKVYSCGISACIGRPMNGQATNIWTFKESTVPSDYSGSCVGYCYLPDYGITLFATTDKLYISGTTANLFKDISQISSVNEFVEISLPR